MNGLRRLGWASDREGPVSQVNLASWVANSRAAAIGLSWTTIGTITEQGSRFSTRRAILPEGVDYALGSLSTLTPSLTVLEIQFVLKDEVVRAFDAPLQHTYETYSEERGSSFTAYITPGQQKQDAMLAARRGMRKACGDWFRSNLPGVFSLELREDTLPSCEFITTRVAAPFMKTQHMSFDYYMWRLGLAGDWDVWQSDKLPGLGLRLPRGQGDDAFALVLAGRFDSIFPEDAMESWGGRTREGFANRLEIEIGRMIAAWAARTALIAYQKRLTEIRDRATLPQGKTRAAIQALDSVQKELLHTSADAQRVSRDMAAMAENERSYSRLFEIDFQPLAANRQDNEPSLIQVMQGDTLRRSHALSEAEQHVREVLLTSSNLASTTANLRLQRRITALTWVLLILAILALLVPIYQFVHTDSENSPSPSTAITTTTHT